MRRLCLAFIIQTLGDFLNIVEVERAVANELDDSVEGGRVDD